MVIRGIIQKIRNSEGDQLIEKLGLMLNTPSASVPMLLHAIPGRTGGNHLWFLCNPK